MRKMWKKKEARQQALEETSRKMNQRMEKHTIYIKIQVSASCFISKISSLLHVYYSNYHFERQGSLIVDK